MISHLLLLVSALACVWWIAKTSEDHIMILLKASANDIERALTDLHKLASTGTCSDARHAGNFLLALWDGELNPLNVSEFQYLDNNHMRQALQLFTFLMTTGTSLQKFMSAEAIDQVADNLSTLNCQSFICRSSCNTEPGATQRPAPSPAPVARTLP
ncbi:DUF7673 family protein [Marinobacter sp. UBA2498]|jgi:hypothetical protein|uniref:DUF7673 family protein n=2 Tax=Marinobacter TaxID=2742 RepID=UPI00257BD476|nr:hypothetical protein [Marinobacter sp. UBA2498]|tara:strand:+ start:5042 stop:5512 length:471 start_codon:yes stop_codon:yes gene_type:complete